MRTLHAVIAVLALTAFTAGTPIAQAAPGDPKVAVIFPGPVQDADFNAVGYVAVQEVRKQLGLEVGFSENVAVADAERVAREYIASGHRVVAFHGGQFVTIARKLAPLFPDVAFVMQSSGSIPDLPPNVWNIGRKWHRGFYPLGVLAALATRTNKIGFIAGIRLPDFIAVINSIQQAVLEYNPKAVLVHGFTGDQNDGVKARQVAETQIAGGVDFIVIAVNLGAYGVIEAAQAAKRPVLVSTFTTDKYQMAPKVMTASLLADFRKPYVEILGRILKGERGGYYEFGPGTGMELSEIRNVSPDVAGLAGGAFREVVARKPLLEITDRLVIP